CLCVGSGGAEPGSVAPGLAEPDSTEPGLAKPGLEEPDLWEPDSAVLGLVEPMQPGSGKPDSAHSGLAESGGRPPPERWGAGREELRSRVWRAARHWKSLGRLIPSGGAGNWRWT